MSPLWRNLSRGAQLLDSLRPGPSRLGTPQSRAAEKARRVAAGEDVFPFDTVTVPGTTRGTPAVGSGPSVLPKGPFDPVTTYEVDMSYPGQSPFDVGIGGITVGPGGIGASGTFGGIPINVQIPIGGGSGSGGSEPSSGQSPTPGNFAPTPSGTSGSCPGLFQVRGPNGTCIDLTALPPGGDPAMTGAVDLPSAGADGYGAAVRGYYGVGLVPRVEVQTVRRCPPGMALGRDGVCYEGLSRNSPKRAHPLGLKPLMTGGDRAAIARAKRVAGSLERAKKTLKKTAKAFEKAGC